MKTMIKTLFLKAFVNWWYSDGKEKVAELREELRQYLDDKLRERFDIPTHSQEVIIKNPNGAYVRLTATDQGMLQVDPYPAPAPAVCNLEFTPERVKKG